MLYAVHTDKGNVKKVNQDSIVVKKAVTENGEMLLAAVCDGMGGLSYGEIASGEAAEQLSEWFNNDLPYLVATGLTTDKLKNSLNEMIAGLDEKIVAFSRQYSDCGTTLAGIYLYNGRYLCVNIGDSRVYRITADSIRQLTHDQTVVQQMLDNNEITKEQAKTHKMRSMLLQCIGVEGDVVPKYRDGTYEEGDVFLLCSDGFRHELEAKEICRIFRPKKMTDEASMKEAAKKAVRKNMQRGERDNISVVVIRT